MRSWGLGVAFLLVGACARPETSNGSPAGAAPADGGGIPASADAGAPASGTDGGVSGTPPPGGQTAPNELTPRTPPGVQRLTAGEMGLGLAVDAQRVYFLSQAYSANPGFDTIAVRSVSRAGGEVSTAAVVEGIVAGQLVDDDDALYFDVRTCSKDPAEDYPCSIDLGGGGRARYRVAKAGGAVKLPDAGGFLLAADAADLYVQRFEELTPAWIDAVSKDGRSSTRFTDRGSASLAATPSGFYWLDVQTVRHRARGSSATDVLPLPDRFRPSLLAVDRDMLFLRGGTVDDVLHTGIYAMSAAGGVPTLLWTAPATPLPSLDAAQGRVFWNQSPSPLDGFPGCAATANADGSGGRCIDRGIYAYGAVRASGNDVFYLRNGDVFRASIDAPEDPDATDGEWFEHGAAAPSPGPAASGSSVLVSGETVGALALDDDNVYWTNSSRRLPGGRPSVVRALPKAGGVPITLASAPTAFDGELETAGGWLFWNSSGYAGSWPGLRRLSTKGGPIEWLGSPYQFAVDGNWIYFQGSLLVGPTGGLDRIDLSGHARAAVAATTYVARVAASLGEIFFVEDLGGNSGSFLRAAREDGSGSRTLAQLESSSNMDRLAADASVVCWIQNGVLSCVPRSGGALQRLGPAIDFDLHAGRLYVTEDTWNGSAFGTGCLWAEDPSGANRVCLDSSTGRLGPVRADDRSVFFVRGSDLVRVDRR